MKYLILITLLFPCSYGFAQSTGYCTQWQKHPVMFCYFNGQKANLWQRHCELIWDKEEVCMKPHPDSLEGQCTKWQKGMGTCWSGKNFEQEWIRECLDTRLRTQACSDTQP